MGFWILSALVVGLILSAIIGADITARKNRKQPKIERIGEVVDKRVNWTEGSSSKTFYITCEFEKNERKEIIVREDKYGLFVVGDKIKVTSQGTWDWVERVVT
ncbi:DUF2500 family protein [Paenibacillus polymyxa]|uniref:Protein of uncharacterized function DUF2500 n=1 Tax=Paenibacillus polymyxa TaxID=1406 RepID=A0A378Y0F2_PAEPO|nr:DUF2500 family protein [Paenibacillus polymyxa]MBE7899866.1 DUF2500 family protein [Paenibacillus polymyxa]MBG9765339.1 hypothetical protein [Paenibacillus polymyxa]MCC3259114.1 DUF2500 domain-containing protein [Paenibacillus polymyxa]QPK55029.1 DUF2500 family protein [Paenibacillus polymyxa]QPK60119.1 DUF2500 family protein [Paenibacillus polymyxa]